MMDPRARHLIYLFQMAPHPEGGYFRELYRSNLAVQPGGGRPLRAALTTIYFLLAAGQLSRWHRVSSDEVWHYYEGGPLELFTADANFERMSCQLLGRADEADTRPVHVVSANTWQAARPTGAYTLAGCTVGPGFDFADFQLLRDCPEEAAELTRRHPEWKHFI